jgi:hypothetical protein
MRPINPVVVEAASIVVSEAARELATEYDIAEDVAQVALMTWLDNIAEAVIRHPVFFSSCTLQAAGHWEAALSEAKRLKDEQIGPWLPPETEDLNAVRLDDARQGGALLITPR